MDKIKQHIPNSLTILRILLAPLFPFVPVGWRLPIVLIAAATEYLDGALSRLWKVTSKLGQMLDPIADKLFVLSMIATFWWEGLAGIGIWLLLGIRDLTVFLGCIVVFLTRDTAKEEFARMQPRILGKITTTFQFLCLFSLVLWRTLHWGLIALTAILGTLAAVDYIVAYFRDVRQDPQPKTT